MMFNNSNLKLVLETIEETLCFSGTNLSDPQDWDIKLNLPVQDIINKSPNEIEKIRYTIKTLEVMNYIKFINDNYSVIGNITPSGLKFLFSELHGVKFI